MPMVWLSDSGRDGATHADDETEEVADDEPEAGADVRPSGSSDSEPVRKSDRLRTGFAPSLTNGSGSLTVGSVHSHANGQDTSLTTGALARLPARFQHCLPIGPAGGRTVCTLLGLPARPSISHTSHCLSSLNAPYAICTCLSSASGCVPLQRLSITCGDPSPPRACVPAFAPPRLRPFVPSPLRPFMPSSPAHRSFRPRLPRDPLRILAARLPLPLGKQSTEYLVCPSTATPVPLDATHLA
jgi:hypothetical protein